MKSIIQMDTRRKDIEEVVQKTRRHTFQEDLGRFHLTWNEAEDMASDISYWRQAAAQCALQHGRN